ncbi:MAG: hypothetical protein B7Z45_10325, partial [Azorhizobium sp. 12-66-6]
PAYRTLTEFFVFPDKFLYFDIDLSTKVLGEAGAELSIFFYFNKNDAALERAVTRDFFALGCTPVVNLFPQRCDMLGRSSAADHRMACVGHPIDEGASQPARGACDENRPLS